MSKKNILVIFADQMTRFAMNCIGNNEVETPNLDKLAQGGTLFTNAYSATPVCSPFRVNLVSGRYACETGAKQNNSRLPEKSESLINYCNDGGYHTGFVGKWHVGASGNLPVPEELRAGFKSFVGYQCYNGFYKDVCFYNEDGNETRYEKHRTDVTGDLAIERLELVADKPFVMIVGFQAPHYPEQPAPEFDKLYRGRKVTPRPNYTGIDPYIPTYSPYSPRPFELCPDFRRYGNDIYEYLRMYYGMVTQIDFNVGRILTKLDELGLREDTIVMFTSDHGDLAGSHGLNGKNVSYEESCGIPLIMNGPMCPEGFVVKEPVDSSGFMATCMEIAQIPMPDDIRERSFLKLLQEKTVTNDAYANLRDWLMVRSGDYKLTVNHETYETMMLFNITDDPYEMDNLAGKEGFAAIEAELLAKIKNWHARCLQYNSSL